MSLWDLTELQNGTINGFSRSFALIYQQRLEELGFQKNATVRCLRKSRFQGACTLQIGDSVFSLARDVAESVMIEG